MHAGCVWIQTAEQAPRRCSPAPSQGLPSNTSLSFPILYFAFPQIFSSCCWYELISHSFCFAFRIRREHDAAHMFLYFCAQKSGGISASSVAARCRLRHPIFPAEERQCWEHDESRLTTLMQPRGALTIYASSFFLERCIGSWHLPEKLQLVVLPKG